MYGDAVLGDIPYGDVDVNVDDLFDFAAMLEASRAQFVYTATVDARNVATDATEAFQFASRTWVTEPDDYPASLVFEDRLVNFSFRRSIVGETLGVFSTGDGKIVILNTDGAFDAIVDTYAIDGQEVVIRVGRVDDLFVNHLVLFRGQATDWSADEDNVTIELRDLSFKLDVPAQPVTYLGTGGAEGGADLRGKRKPIEYGVVSLAPATLVDSSKLIYEANDGVGMSVQYVHDRGAQLSAGTARASYAALAAATVTPGTFDTYGGYFRLGSEPAGFVLATGTDVGSDYSLTAMIAGILDRATDLVEQEIDRSSMDVLEAALAGQWFGFFLGPDEAATAADVIARLMEGVGGWAGFTRDGRFTVGVVQAPAGEPVASFNEQEGDTISLSRDRLPASMWPPPWRVRVAYFWAWFVTTDLAASIPSSVKAFLSQPYRLAVAEDAAVLADHPLAQDRAPVDAYFYNQVDAQAEADRRLALFNAGYHLYRFTTNRRALLLDIGKVIHVTHPRFGLDAGRLMVVVELSYNIALGEGSGVDTVEVVAFG